MSPSQSDACTWWPDGWPTWMGGTGDEWRHCCAAHDSVPKAIADDLALGACVAEVAPLMGVVMAAGVLTFGTLYVLARKSAKPNK